MKLRSWYWLLLAMCGSQASAEIISHGRFENFTVLRPPGEVRETVLFFSGGRARTAESESIARALASQGALVANIDTSKVFGNFERDAGECVSPEGDLENLSHFLQAYYRLPGYRPAVLMGRGAGSPFVYSMLARAPRGTFAGGVSLGFCPEQTLQKPLCPSAGAPADAEPSKQLPPPTKLDAPWLVLMPADDPVCAGDARKFISAVKNAQSIPVAGNTGKGSSGAWEAPAVDAFQKLAARAPARTQVAAAELEDLPLVEVSAQGSGDTLAVLISGDGGWAGIDKELAAALSKQGMPVVGLDSLRYFWNERTPESTAVDIDRILRYYLATWNKRSAVLIGFSQGADVMPFIINRLPSATRARLSMAVFLSLSQTAVFEFHLQNWLGGDRDAVPIEPELRKMSGVRGLCIYGEDDAPDSLCPSPAAKRLQIVKLPGGHHFDGNYARLATLILSRVR